VASHSRGSHQLAAAAQSPKNAAVIELLDDEEEELGGGRTDGDQPGRQLHAGSTVAGAPSPPSTVAGDSSGSSSALLERGTDWRALPRSAAAALAGPQTAVASPFELPQVEAACTTLGDDLDDDLDDAVRSVTYGGLAARTSARGPGPQQLHTVCALAATPRSARGRLGTVAVVGALSDFGDDAPLDFSVAHAGLMSLALRCTLVGPGGSEHDDSGATGAALVVQLPSQWVEARLGLGSAASVYTRLKGADTPKDARRRFKRELADALNERVVGTAGVFTLDLAAAAAPGDGVDAVLVAWAP
jgi:hypothetical protein